MCYRHERYKETLKKVLRLKSLVKSEELEENPDGSKKKLKGLPKVRERGF